jgi:glycerol-3-phosphate dehydrogenase (NAD(P)+)
MDEDKAQMMANLLACRYIKTSITEDVFGTEISAVYKNVVAIASGLYHGLGYGDNFQAVLMSNAIREIKRFVDAVSPVHRDVNSSAYLGDLLVTGYSQFSRNRTFGTMLGKGYTVKFAQLEMNMIAEGYYAAKSLVEINKKFDVSIPIADAVNRVLYEKMSPQIEMRLLADKLN